MFGPCRVVFSSAIASSDSDLEDYGAFGSNSSPSDDKVLKEMEEEVHMVMKYAIAASSSLCLKS